VLLGVSLNLGARHDFSGQAQRLIEAIETLVRIHAAQEDDIYDAVASR
jgi:hypothetical protein